MMNAADEVKAMTYNLTGAPNRSRISMNEEREVIYWTGTLGCSKDELAAAVARVGHSSDTVRREVFRAWAYGRFPPDGPKTEAPSTRPATSATRPRSASPA